MLDRWSVMVFERAIISNPKMSVSYIIDPILTSYEATLDLHMQSIIEAEDLQIIISSTKTICETVNSILGRLNENCREDVQLNIKCDILRQKLDMLLDTLIEETNGVYNDDDLLKTLNSIIRKSFNDRYGTAEFKTINTIGKTEKDKLNSKEKFNRLKKNDKEALQCRSNSFKRAIRNIVQHPERERPVKPSRRMSLRMESLRVQQTQSSSEGSPCTSPYPIPPINLISPSLSTTCLTCISPLPDLRRDSMDETFLNTLNLPVPTEFADNGSRRSSGVPEVIQEGDEAGAASNSANDGSLLPNYQNNGGGFDKEKFPGLKVSREEIIEKSSEYLGISGNCYDDQNGLIGFTPVEVYERNLLRSTKILQDKEDSEHENAITMQHASKSPSPFNVPELIVPDYAGKEGDNIYVSENMTIIDTDPPDKSSSDDIPGEASDVLSAISNEECSLSSEILDKPLEHYTLAADVIQDLETDQIGHIDSPETSDTTDALHGESLLDDISSVLGHDLLGALQDSTITEDTTTLCTEKPRKRSFKRNKQPPPIEDEDDEITQFGFENIVFEIDNRCDDQKAEIRYCSLAQFVEGNDIARKSFKRPKTKCASSTANTSKPLSSKSYIPQSADTEMLVTDPQAGTSTAETLFGAEVFVKDNLDTIKIQIQGSHVDLSTTDNEADITVTSATTTTTATTLRQSQPATSDVRHISFQHDVKFDDDDDDDYEPQVPRFNMVVEPPSPQITDELRAQRISEIRRHSSHAPSSLSTKEFEKEKDRRHSGYNPNLLGLDSEHMRFLHGSPAATRRISSGSLFKVSSGFFQSVILNSS